jgi:hypothetical protein
MGIQSCERSYTDHYKKGKGKLSVELNSSYSIDEVNVRFKTQDVLDKDLMVISLETPVHPLRYHQQQKRSCRYCQYSWIVFCIRSRKYLLRYYEKNSTDNFSTSNYDGIIGSGYTSNQNLSLSGERMEVLLRIRKCETGRCR